MSTSITVRVPVTIRKRGGLRSRAVAHPGESGGVPNAAEI